MFFFVCLSVKHTMYVWIRRKRIVYRIPSSMHIDIFESERFLAQIRRSRAAGQGFPPNLSPGVPELIASLPDYKEEKSLGG